MAFIFSSLDKMAGNLSLESAIRTCKIDVAYANKMYSDRYLNPTQMVCPVWNGYDSAGRPTCADAFMTKAAGCNSAEDRISVENNVARPRYFEYITLNPSGLSGNIYGDQNTITQWDKKKTKSDTRDINAYAGNFGIQFGSVVRSGCGGDAYARAMGYEQTSLRNAQMLDNSYNSFKNKSASGM